MLKAACRIIAEVPLKILGTESWICTYKRPVKVYFEDYNQETKGFYWAILDTRGHPERHGYVACLWRCFGRIMFWRRWTRRLALQSVKEEKCSTGNG